MRTFLFAISFLGLLGCRGPSCNCDYRTALATIENNDYELSRLENSVAANEGCKAFCNQWNPMVKVVPSP